MSDDELPEDVREFIGRYIDSVEQLRVLLLLGANPDRAWTLAEITEDLRSSEISIAQRLAGLYERKVLLPAEEGGDPRLHRFTPGSPGLRPLVRQLIELNRAKPYRLIDAIYSRPSSSLRAFSEAFKWKGGDR